MYYVIHKLDNRFSYREWFQFYIGFSASMSDRHGPLHFNSALKWFIEHYGWSAEIRQYDKMTKWTTVISRRPFASRIATNMLTELPGHCNPYWSWSNGYNDLRIYVASDQELAFWQLAHPVDQKTQ